MDLMKDLGVEVYKDAARPAVSEVGAFKKLLALCEEYKRVNQYI
jgi:hypothetical protein